MFSIFKIKKNEVKSSKTIATLSKTELKNVIGGTDTEPTPTPTAEATTTNSTVTGAPKVGYK